jgi:uncharacterized membrane protein
MLKCCNYHDYDQIIMIMEVMKLNLEISVSETKVKPSHITKKLVSCLVNPQVSMISLPHSSTPGTVFMNIYL